MINIVLAGVGGKGSMLAAKVLTVAAASRGWNVRMCETLGLAQRGGSVMSHVRIADRGEEILSPVVTRGTANLIIGFEPGEAARALPYLMRTGSIITATTPVEPTTAAMSIGTYNVNDILQNIKLALYNATVRNLKTRGGSSAVQARLIPVDDMAITDMLDGNRKSLSSILLAAAVKANCLPFSADELCRAVEACVKADFLEMNITAIETVLSLD